MRIWGVPWCELDDKRILDLHRTLHALLGMRAKQMYHPLLVMYTAANLRYLHDTLLPEMRIRGQNHNTPVVGDRDATGAEKQLRSQFEDRCELLYRWGGRFKGRENTHAGAWTDAFNLLVELLGPPEEWTGYASHPKRPGGRA
jgi:hypothetical protein